MTPEAERSFRAHAIAEYPRECCGLVAMVEGVQYYLPCRNVAGNSESEFVIHRDDYCRAEDVGEIVALAHSHPDANAKPSMADRLVCENQNMPSYIVSVGRDVDGNVATFEMTTLEPCGYRPPLIGRPFVHGVLDCYTLVRDYYKQELGIDLPQIEREDNWWNKGGNLYMDNYAAAGFSETDISDLRVGDLILMQIRSPKPNHGAVYIGNSQIMHHLMPQASRRDLYDGYFREVTRMVLRHKDAPQ